MGGSGPTSQITGVVPQMLPPNYAYNRQFFNEILPGWTNYQPGSYQDAGGRGNRQASPSQQAATMMMQQWATSPLNQESNAYTQGVLGNLYGTGGAINQFHQPTSADNALERFLSPGSINPQYGGAPWAQGFNMGYGGFQPQYQPQMQSMPGPQTGGGPGPGMGIFTPPGQGQPNGRGGQG
jgi:hypothetical protein